MTKKPRVTEQYALRHLKSPAVFTKQSLEAWVSLHTLPKSLDLQDNEVQELLPNCLEDYSQLWVQAVFWKAFHTYGAIILSTIALVWTSSIYTLTSVSMPYEAMIILAMVVTFVLYQFAAPFAAVISPSFALNRHAWDAVYEYLLAVEHAGHYVKDQESSIQYNKAVLRAVDFAVATGVITSSGKDTK